MGVGLLREIYIKTNNFIGGRYFAEIIKQVMKDLEDQKYVMAELRLSVYGVKYSEFTELAKWAIEQKVCCRAKTRSSDHRKFHQKFCFHRVLFVYRDKNSFIPSYSGLFK